MAAHLDQLAAIQSVILSGVMPESKDLGGPERAGTGKRAKHFPYFLMKRHTTNEERAYRAFKVVN
ncbi:MAG TPA: hypothetical protein VMA09_23140 [Candidatus Binataceae bacterium]|nr:hypothetical protein [Candidatus Binataceae bacterium]